MKCFTAKRFLQAVMLLFLPGLAGQDLFATGGTNITQTLPPPADIKINFDRDIRPIFEASCLSCHGPQKPKSDFRLDYREGALAGGDDNTNDIVPGNSRESKLIAYVARQVPEMEMPPVGKGAALTTNQIALLRAWIDQGADWSTTNIPQTLTLMAEPVAGGFVVHGNDAKFREIQGVEPGAYGGVQNFSAEKQISPDEKISVSGHAIVPNQDLNVQLALDKTESGFIHAGFDQWRKYYGTDGGYDPTITPPIFNLDQNLYVDNGHAWIDFGLDLPRWPVMVLGYEYQYQKGNEATLDWGYANGKNIYPATQSLDEKTHSIKFDLTANFDDWKLENNARVDFYRQNNEGMEASILFGGTQPDEFINTKDNYQHVQGMDTLTLEKQLLDWWYLDGGFYYSRLAGDDYFVQTTAIPSIGFNNTLSSQKITLDRESEIFSLANLFRPLNYLTFSLGTQNEWTREKGFSDGIPDLELGGATTVPASSSLDDFKASQDANFRYTRIPFTIVSGDAQFSEDNYGIEQAEDTDDLQRNTAAENFRYDLKTGFSTSPWQWGDLTVQYERQYSDTVYNQLEDIVNGISGPTNGYPGFILARNITSDQFETKLALRPANWLKVTLTYQINDTDYSSKTDPAYDFILNEIVSEGGSIADGDSHAHTYGIGATLTPYRRLYFSGQFTYSQSRITTADNGDPSIVPYQGYVLAFNGTATYLLNLKSSLRFSYNFSSADYAQNNAAAGIPVGLDYSRNDLIVGLTRKLTTRLSCALNYEFSQYTEPSTAGSNNFTANGIMATLSYHWR
ncbi:MAG TPA: c-type cytochrome domain-containing protein [Pseudomonadales bacterium]|nr:c-type cytochrome domain-containing protein [Pseudomonadales bacterium]